MFRAAFPWARAAEEKAEKEYIKSLDAASREEVAGNIWVSEPTALDLAKDYGMTPWVAALLDPASVSKGSENMTKSITPPPKYVFTANDQTFLPPPASRGSTPARSRGRPPRNASPTKSDKAASPRKHRATKVSKAENAANAKAAAAILQDTLAEGTKTNTVSTLAKGEENIVKLELSEVTEVNGNIETTTTNVKLDLPGGMAADVPPQEMTQELMREAQAMVEETRRLEGGSSKASRKRKAEELDESDEEGDDELQPAKKARLVNQKYKKEQVKKRALFGVAFTLAVGSVLPYFL
ncbi:MAG: hypothetical protein LQ350_000401 [Teloschistes chrysophthalmus]|nr:MAG: hypothetical protein LQ350_000401 [Niorma chrysophthalma]